LSHIGLRGMLWERERFFKEKKRHARDLGLFEPSGATVINQRFRI